MRGSYARQVSITWTLPSTLPETLLDLAIVALLAMLIGMVAAAHARRQVR